MAETQRRRCPKCRKGDELWEPVMVQGWRTIDEYLKPDGRDQDADWMHVERDTWASPEVGCACGWEGGRDELEVLGIDGEPLPEQVPGQMSISDAA